jgi:hypothetical protein
VLFPHFVGDAGPGRLHEHGERRVAGKSGTIAPELDWSLSRGADRASAGRSRLWCGKPGSVPTETNSQQ